MPPTPDNIVVFDGVCKLCAYSVRFILEHERDHVLRFTPLQSAAGAKLLRQFGLDPAQTTTVVLFVDGNPYLRSDAAIRLARHLRGAWRLLALLKILPRPIRDWGYDVVARYRYRWFGRLDSCLPPIPGLSARFIDELDEAT